VINDVIEAAAELLLPARLLAPEGLRDDLALVHRDGRILALPPKRALGEFAALPRRELAECLLAPGFIDLQANGGGGALFNDAPSLDTLTTITRAHRRFGTTALLATLISDSPERTAQAQVAVAEALKLGLAGLLGLHLEGPHLSPERCGVHAPEHFRALDQAEVQRLLAAHHGPLLLTLAPEQVEPRLIAALSEAGVRVFAGHTAATFEQVQAALTAGLAGFTHLFNAMPPLAGRAPGPVGAALLDPHSACGLIVDGHHLHAAALRLTLRCKPRGRCFLVSDAMPSLGSEQSNFELYGRRIEVKDGRLQTADGVLAGAQLDLATAVRNCVQLLDLPLDEALRMASTYPAEVMGVADDYGQLRPGARADLVLLGHDLQVRGSWIGGEFEAADVCGQQLRPAAHPAAGP